MILLGFANGSLSGRRMLLKEALSTFYVIKPILETLTVCINNILGGIRV